MLVGCAGTTQSIFSVDDLPWSELLFKIDQDDAEDKAKREQIKSDVNKLIKVLNVPPPASSLLFFYGERTRLPIESIGVCVCVCVCSHGRARRASTSTT